jgi:hypothetical protein
MHTPPSPIVNLAGASGVPNAHAHAMLVDDGFALPNPGQKYSLSVNARHGA